MSLRKFGKRLARRAGYDIVPLAKTFGGKYERLLKQYAVNLVLDVGAYKGDYAQILRRLNYAGRIVSFEPMATAFAQLQTRAQTDPHWTAVNLALGDQDKQATLNISGMPMSSSLLEMLPTHLTAAPASGYVGSESVEVRALDSIFSQYCQPGDKVFLKLDTQGFERAVLAGAAQSLPRVVGMQVELSFSPLYSGELTIGPMVDYLAGLGFSLMALTTGFESTRDQVMQVYGLFFRIPD